jgi:hypothetical protein
VIIEGDNQDFHPAAAVSYGFGEEGNTRAYLRFVGTYVLLIPAIASGLLAHRVGGFQQVSDLRRYPGALVMALAVLGSAGGSWRGTDCPGADSNFRGARLAQRAASIWNWASHQSYFTRLGWPLVSMRGIYPGILVIYYFTLSRESKV